MFNYLVRRLALGLLTLLLITFLVYALIRNMPGTPLTADPAMMNPGKMPSQDDIKRWEKLYGLDKPWYQAYFVWLGNVVRFDLGRSIPQNNKPVSELIVERVPGHADAFGHVARPDLSALDSDSACGRPFARGTVRERTVSTLLYMLYSLPAFVAALLSATAVLLEARLAAALRHDERQLRLAFDLGKAWDIFKHAILADHLLHLRQPGLRLAVHPRQHAGSHPPGLHSHRPGKGRAALACHLASRLSQHADSVRHAPRPDAAAPAERRGHPRTDLQLARHGPLFFEAIGQRDYDTIMGLTLMFSVLTLLGQLLADILYAVVDPRVTYQ